MADQFFGKWTETYTSFSGADIVCVFGNTVIATLSGITWSVTREKAPIYTMGSPNPRSFSRGKRGIAGSMIFTTFDKGALWDLVANNKSDPSIKYATRTVNSGPIRGGKGITPAYSTTEAGGVTSTNAYMDVNKYIPYYADQIPPFDITATYANEYGQAAVKRIYGVELLNEGSGASMDDVVIEETMTFVAREVGPMVPLDIHTDGGDFDATEITNTTTSIWSDNK